MIGMVDLSGKKGTGIHGIVEEYMAKGNISAGGFVKIIDNTVQTATQSDKIYRHN